MIKVITSQPAGPCYGMMGGSFKCTSVTAAVENT